MHYPRSVPLELALVNTLIVHNVNTKKLLRHIQILIFKKTTPDESQALENGPRFNTWYKGWFTRSEIYERMMPDGLTSALRMEGPESGGSAIVMNSKGNIENSLLEKRTDVSW